MFSATVAENRKLSSATNAICDRSELTSTLRRSAPSTSTVPRLGAYNRASSATRLVFPDPDGPTSATVRPASTVSSTSSSAGGAPARTRGELPAPRRRRPAVVGEGDVAQLDRARTLGERRGIRRALDPRL